ncbi:MAG: SusC/RagA family TonB-linked outer membrane protein, partial [Panacibacter sp.]
MNFKRLFVMLALPLVILSLPVLAQDKIVTGKVTDLKDGKPIAGASVLVKGTNIGTQSKTDGSFSLSTPANATTLVISYVGYASQELLIGNGSLSVSLVQSNSTLSDVVVVAYGTRKKGDLTGSVTSVTTKDFQKGVNNSSEQLLQGKVAGLQVTSGGGSAGGGSKIRIRGGASLNASNDPLIVIDGVPVEGNGLPGSANLLNTINPNDIESMSVLKDASATALYGSRASNGVIIITTKKGAKGGVKYNFNTTASAGVVGKTVDVLSADQIRTIINNDAAATGINTYKDILGSNNTNWQDQIYQTALGFDNNISASGSIGKLPFRASLGYLNQDGILKTNNFNRLTSSLNLSPKFLKDHLSVNLALKGSKTGNRFANEGAIGSAIYFDPTQPIYADNKYGGYFEWLQPDGKPIDLATRNPLGLLNLQDNTSDVNRLIGNIQVDYNLHFLPDLHVLVNVGIDNAKGSGDVITDSIAATNYKTAGYVSHYEQKKKNTLADVSLLYNKELKSLNSKFDLLVGHSYQDFVTDVSNFAAFGQDGDTIPNSTPTFATDKPEYRLESYLGRLNFTVANKYLLTASIRRDASSKFAKGNRIGYFPAFAGAWKLKEEFFKNTTIISDLKLRVGWGITGQQDGIGYYSYLPRYTRSFNTGAQYQFGDAFYSYLRPEGYDANLKWETTTTSNIGLDFAFLNNRISGTVDFYKKKTKDLLREVPVAPGANFVNLLTINVG